MRFKVGWGEAAEDGFQLALPAPHHDLGGDCLDFKAGGGHLMGLAPAANFVRHAADGFEGGRCIRGGDLIPESECVLDVARWRQRPSRRRSSPSRVMPTKSAMSSAVIAGRSFA